MVTVRSRRCPSLLRAPGPRGLPRCATPRRPRRGPRGTCRGSWKAPGADRSSGTRLAPDRSLPLQQGPWQCTRSRIQGSPPRPESGPSSGLSLGLWLWLDPPWEGGALATISCLWRGWPRQPEGRGNRDRRALVVAAVMADCLRPLPRRLRPRPRPSDASVGWLLFACPPLPRRGAGSRVPTRRALCSVSCSWFSGPARPRPVSLIRPTRVLFSS
mmetsp:Transcript_58025/g.155128  ORF Transcript_58025/g.155128 Transcript_58025/m.155128 type:complete len:215 (+) Transcript_58025:351-995(+)